MQDDTTAQSNDKTTDGRWSNMAASYYIGGQNPKRIPVDNVVPSTAELIRRYQELETRKDQLEGELMRIAAEQHQIDSQLAESDRRHNKD